LARVPLLQRRDPSGLFPAVKDKRDGPCQQLGSQYLADRSELPLVASRDLHASAGFTE